MVKDFNIDLDDFKMDLDKFTRNLPTKKFVLEQHPDTKDIKELLSHYIFTLAVGIFAYGDLFTTQCRIYDRSTTASNLIFCVGVKGTKYGYWGINKYLEVDYTDNKPVVKDITSEIYSEV